MMLVPVRADRSPIHGLGLFAAELIPAGTPVWRLDPGFDSTFDRTAFESLPAPAREHLRHYGYLDASTGCWVLNGDLAIFLNHAPTPNTGAPGHAGAAAQTIALRDIQPGEELTCDYAAFDAGNKPVQ
jgi:hypothetical protein